MVLANIIIKILKTTDNQYFTKIVINSLKTLCGSINNLKFALVYTSS